MNCTLLDQYFSQLNPNYPPGFSRIHPDLQPTQQAVAALGSSAYNFETALRNHIQLGLKAINDVPVQSSALWSPNVHPGNYRIVRVQSGGDDWGSSEFGSAATAGGAITTAGIAIVGLSTNATVAAAIGAGVLVGAGLLIAGIGLVILTYSAIKLIQIANGKFIIRSGGGKGPAPKSPPQAIPQTNSSSPILAYPANSSTAAI